MGIVKIELIGDPISLVNASQKGSSALKLVDTACNRLSSTMKDLVVQGAKVGAGFYVFEKLASQVSSAVPATEKLASETGKLMRMTGMSAEAASELIAVGDQVKVSYGALEQAVIQITRRMGGLKDIESMVVDVSGQAVDVFEKFHLQVKNTDGSVKSFADVFDQIRSRIQGASSETERMAIATQFFRGNAAELMPLLIMSKDQWRALADDAQRYGLILSGDNVQSVRQYVMAHRDLDDAFTGLKVVIGRELIPHLTEMTTALTENVAVAKDFIAENKALLSLPFDTLKYAKENVLEVFGPVALGLVVAYRAEIAALIESMLALSATITLTTAAQYGLGAGLALLFGMELGKLIDQATYSLSRGQIDLSGQQRLGEAISWNATQTEFLKERSKKYEEVARQLGFRTVPELNKAIDAGTVAYDKASGKWINLARDMKAAEEATKKEVAAMREWQVQIEALNPALTETDKRLMELNAAAEELRKEFGNKSWIEQWLQQGYDFITKKDAMDMQRTTDELRAARLSGIDKELAAAKLKYEKGVWDHRDSEAAKKLLTENYAAERAEIYGKYAEEGTKKEIEWLTAYRESLVATYDEAIAKAQEYYKKAVEINKAVADNEAWRKGLNAPKLTPDQQYYEEYKKVKGLISAETFNLTDPAKTQETITAIRGFVDTYKDFRSSMGFSSQFEISSVLASFNELQGKLKGMQTDAEQSGIQWQAWGQTAVQAIDAADQRLFELDTRLRTVDAILEQMHTFQLDTSEAMQKLQGLEVQAGVVINMLHQAAAFSASPPVRSYGNDYYGNVAPQTFKVPGAASGGYFTKPTLIAIAEREPEYAIPESKLRQVGPSKDITITIGDIVIQGVNNPEEIARKIVKPLQRELRRLAYIGGN